MCLNKTFKPSTNEHIGRERPLTEYTLKIYDKGLESKVLGNILRVEAHFDRMRKVKELGISSLADLKDTAKVERLLGLIQEAWHHVLLFDRALLQNTTISVNERAFLEQCQFGEYWQREHEKGISRAAMKKKRDRLITLIRQHGRDYKTEIENEINRTWQTLFINKRLTKSPLR